MSQAFVQSPEYRVTGEDRRTYSLSNEFRWKVVINGKVYGFFVNHTQASAAAGHINRQQVQKYWDRKREDGIRVLNRDRELCALVLYEELAEELKAVLRDARNDIDVHP